MAELLALAAAAATFAYVGWDGALWDARLQLLLHLFGFGAAAGLGALAWRGLDLPRTRVDLPILMVVAAFGVACLSADNTGLAARALAAIIGFSLMLPAALVAVRARPQWVAGVVLAPILAFSAATLGVMVWRRLAWFAVNAPTIVPPLRIGGEGNPFGSVATPPFMLLAAAPLTMLIADPGWRRRAQLALVAVGAPLAVLSGSRSAWIAIAVAGIAYGSGMLRHLALPRHWSPRTIALAWLGALAAAAAVAVGAPRLASVSSLAYRIDLWRDTLTAWSRDPLTGIGPGTMPYARQAAAEALSFPARQPHSHNLPLGLLGDAGLLGLAAGGVLLVTFFWWAGPWRANSATGRLASSVLLGLAVSGLFEDLTFLPGFDLLVIVLAAMSLADAGAVRWSPVARRMRRPLAVAAAVVVVSVGVPWVAGDAAAIAYRGAMDRAEWSDWHGAAGGLLRSSLLNPWQPATPKAMAVVADAAGDATLAISAARRAVELNAGDGQSWTNLAVLCLSAGDGTCAMQAAEQAAARADPFDVELANAAVVIDHLGDVPRADGLYRLSLLTNVATGINLPWPRRVEPGTTPMGAIDRGVAQLNLLVAHRLAGDRIDPAAYDVPIVRALAFQMVGDGPSALSEMAVAQRASPYEAATWDLSALLTHARGGGIDQLLAVGGVIRGAPLPSPGHRTPVDLPALTYDISSFRIYPRDGLVRGATRLRGRTAYPWYLAPLLDPAFRPGAGGG